MPIDLTIDSKFGLRYDYHIPNNWFVKEDSKREYLLPKWTGYGNLNKEYKFKTQVPSGIKNVMIDLSGRLADSYAIDNNQKGNIDFSIDYGVRKWANLRKYEVKARPDFWYNSYDGMKIGTNIETFCNSMAFLKGGSKQYFACGYANGVVKIYDCQEATEVAEL